jgi:regulator of replication initiation timing
MAIIVYCFNRRTLQLDKKDRERPIMVELMRFFIAPIKYRLSSQKGSAEFEELNLEKIFPKLLYEPLYMEFNTLLERLALKSEWDEKLQNYNELARNLHGKIDELKQKIRKFIDENQDIKRIYDKTEANKSYTFDDFKNELVNRFYETYRSNLHDNKLGGAWYFAGSEIFNHVKLDNKPILEEIDKLRENVECRLDDLISFLEQQIQKRLRKEYNLTPSEQELSIKALTHAPIPRIYNY